MNRSSGLRAGIDVVIFAGLSLWLVIDPLLVDSKAYRSFRSPKEWFGTILVCPLIGLWLLSELEKERGGRDRSVRGNFNPAIVGALVFLGWNAVSLLYATPKGLGLESLMHLGSRLFTAIIICRTLTTNKVRWLMGGVFSAATCSACYSVMQYYGLDPLFEPVKSYYTGRWLASGLIGQPTLLGAYLGMVVPVSVAYFFRSGRLYSRVGYLLLTVILVIALLCTHTRAVLLGLLCCVGPFALLVRRKASFLISNRKPLIAAIGAALLMVIVPFIIANPSIGERFSLMSGFKTDSVGARIFYWRVISEMIADRPILGSGLGTFKFHYYDYQCLLLREGTSLRPYTKQLVFHAHNEYLQTAVESGLIGVSLLFCLIALVFKVGLLRISTAATDEDRILLIGLLSSLIVALFDAIFSFPFHVASTGLLTAVFSGILIAPIRQERRHDET